MADKLERIDKIISNQTGISRKDIKIGIKKGFANVDGEVIKNSQSKFNPNMSRITYMGKHINYKKHIYLMMNKPKGVLSATEDKSSETVIELVPEDLSRSTLFPAGRLDKDTTGFLLLTDDGDFAHKMLNPKHNVPKTYSVIIDKHLSEEDISRLEKGMITNAGNIFKPAKVTVIENIENHQKIEIIISEGKHHQIKRMILAINSEVLELKRIAIGNLFLDKNLSFGECREINNEELHLIM